MKLKRLRVLIALFAFLAAYLATFSAQAAPQEKSLYIVKFQDNVSLGDEISATRRNGISIDRVLEHSFKGFIGEMTATQAAALSRNPRIEFVELDSEVYANVIVSQPTTLWGLDRIDERQIDSSQTYIYDDARAGQGVNAYVIDTGIRSSHIDFTSRVGQGINFVGNLNGDLNTNDCQGHGTHVAGTIGGDTYGVAKKVALIPVRVLDCNGSGTVSGVVAGVNWVAGQKKSSPALKAVANMSLGGSISKSIDTAVNNLVKAGVVVVVAAGNSETNACNRSPARVSSAITVGATDSSDVRASFSNIGSCLDLFAPGVSIMSTWNSGDSASALLSGTSMASPHVAGVVARYLSSANASASQATSEIVGYATSGVVKNAGSRSPNKLLFWDK